ncbi:uncharacterized protein LOC132719563 [Ruditapes philippinarum]|uniref:uncharacterized protein LOC132719563 n=1 Tax=Ruditapes philippinarum TaxID=129788 RepID=UPI00295AF144|nr:uncharacterized protein LOC132719563 [Ruditapes philippinarum]
MNAGLLCVAILAASTHAFSIHSGNVEEKLRLLNPSFMMMEQLFNLQDETQCIEKLFCLMETEMAGEVENPLKHYSRFLTNLYQEIEPLAFEKVKGLLAKYPHISKVIDAIAFGQRSNSEACNVKYEECPNEKSELVAFAKMLGDNVVNKHMPGFLAKRGDPVCTGAGISCGLIGGGCALCTVATEGACGLLCGPEVAAACSGAGIGCAVKDGK